MAPPPLANKKLISAATLRRALRRSPRNLGNQAIAAPTATATATTKATKATTTATTTTAIKVAKARNLAVEAAIRGLALVQEYRARGHLFAQLDPLARCRGPLAAAGRWPTESRVPVTGPIDPATALEDQGRTTTTTTQDNDNVDVVVADDVGADDDGAQPRPRPKFCPRKNENDVFEDLEGSPAAPALGRRERRRRELRERLVYVPPPSGDNDIHIGPYSPSFSSSCFPSSTSTAPSSSSSSSSTTTPATPTIITNTPSSSSSSSSSTPKPSKLPRSIGGWLPENELVERLEAAYCGTIGFEFDHLTDARQRAWFAAAAEQPRRSWEPNDTEKRQLLARLLRTALFEDCLSKKYPSSKRFGLEGCEALIPGLYRLCHRSSLFGTESVVLGMAHRGRLNVLANLLGKPLGLIFAEMKESVSEFHVGDVKYHLGITGTLPIHSSTTDSKGGPNREVQMTIVPNPSHLEVVCPVVLGHVRASQDLLRIDKDAAQQKVLGVVIHGDAAFAGLGTSMEAMQLSGLEGYGTGGTVHVVLDNQIGFTTEPHESRSTAHASAFATGLGAPVMHVNGDDVEAVDRTFELAAEYRARFRRDVVVVLVGYRRQGHNELDDPSVTQPVSYKLVKSKIPPEALYAEKLDAANVATSAQTEAMRQSILSQLLHEYSESARYKKDGTDWLREIYGGRSNRLWARPETLSIPSTGLPLQTLRMVAEAGCHIPDGFAAHPDVQKMLAKRLASATAGGRIDFATAEMLAFGSILLNKSAWSGSEFPFEAQDVRLSGQDSMRGTFRHRHASLTDQSTARSWVPLAHMAPGKQARYTCVNSPLSEMGVLAFEYGYSLGNPDALVCWEAQFGDFANNAQVVIDQFIASGEEKWGQMSRIVLLLPHGYDGQGPDHSSARIERFLQLVNDDPDNLPGTSDKDLYDINKAFDLLDVNQTGVLKKDTVKGYLQQLSAHSPSEFLSAEEAWAEMRTWRSNEAGVDRAEWQAMMQEFYRRSAEVQANIIVVNVTTPAQLFHVLRRQVHRRFRKPLIVMAPKYMLHHAKATSAYEDLGPGSFFRRVIVDYNPFGPEEAGLGDNTRHLAVTKTGEPLSESPANIRRLILCSGQLYYTLSNARRVKKLKDIAILRLEQIAPFPHDKVIDAISFYSNADVVWCQEEPKNMGAWFYVQPRLAAALSSANLDRKVKYVGRPVSAATATGSLAIHLKETKHLVSVAMNLDDQ